MGQVRDPGRDQPLPKPGGMPVQAILIGAIRERTAFGLAKYGDVLRTGNDRNALKDAWEELIDLTAYFTQFVLEQGVVLPGMEEVLAAEGRSRETGSADEVQHVRTKAEGLAATRAKGRIEGLLNISMVCPICGHQPHVPGGCTNDAPSGKTNCQCGIGTALAAKETPTLAVCPNCLHEPHAPGGCMSNACDLTCSCLEAA